MSLLAALVLAGELFSRGLAPVATGAPRAQLSSAACVECHAAAHADWAQSRHGQAFTNAIFQREYRQQPLEWCVHCHAPLREQLAEVRAGGGPLANEGVGCAACHLRDGVMLARTQRPRSPHTTRADPAFGGPQFCAGCHQFNFPVVETAGTERRVRRYSPHPMQDTVAQHARGPLAGSECLSCHTAGAGGHRFPGGHDPAMLARAVAVQTCRSGDALAITLANTGAGHNVPTGDLHRHLVLRAWSPAAPERLFEATFGRRFAAAPDGGKRTVSDRTIPAGGSRRVRVPARRLGGDDGAIRLELRLVYTIDEFPFRGRELAEPTYGVMYTDLLRWSELPSCTARLARADR